MPALPLLLTLALLLITGCAGKQTQAPPGASGVDRQQDGAPADPPDLTRIADAVPRWEPRSRWGNPPSYEVFGQTYRVLDSADGFKERGIASWYGTKFHGRRTSSGEPYDMYAMTAAHKHLPIPVYVRVTNLDNGRQIVVRVNDRGPFAHNRIIDLSYAAAVRLDMLREGTAPVEIEVIDTVPPAGEVIATGAEAYAADSVAGGTTRYLIQAASFSERGNAERLQTRLQNANLGVPVEIQAAELGPRPVYRVRLGPVSSVGQVDRLTTRLTELGLSSPQVMLKD